MARRVLERLNDATIAVQLPLVLLAVPVITGLYGIALTPIVVDVALEEAAPGAIAAARDALRLVVVLMVACVVATTAAAAMLLRGSLRAAVARMQDATDAIARGDFRHRVASRRGDELGELARAIDTMAERLERLEQARRRLLACVSHELRTPLTIIRGHAYTLTRHERDVLRRDRLELIDAEAERLAALIEDLVDASSLHAGSVRLSVEPFDLVALARDQAERFTEEALQRGLRIRIRASRATVMAMVDPARLGQVLANLLANAVRHAEADGHVDVSIEAPDAGACAIVVANRGEAIPAELAIGIFEPFVQGAGRSGRVGLGLAIAHALMSAHGGSLTLDVDRAARGDVRFTCEVPTGGRARGVDHAVARRVVRRRRRRRARVLVVEA